MKVKTRSGELRTQYGMFLPHTENSEYEAEENEFVEEIVEVLSEPYAEFIKPGKYRKVTANVHVTKFYPLNDDQRS